MDPIRPKGNFANGFSCFHLHLQKVTCHQLGKNDTTVDGSEIRQPHQLRLVSYPYVFTRSSKNARWCWIIKENPRKIYSDLSVGWDQLQLGRPSFRNLSEPNSPDFPHVFPPCFPQKTWMLLLPPYELAHGVEPTAAQADPTRCVSCGGEGYQGKSLKMTLDLYCLIPPSWVI